MTKFDLFGCKLGQGQPKIMSYTNYDWPQSQMPHAKFAGISQLVPEKTRIVRGSDYSPASELFARERQTMTGNNAKLDLVNVDAHKKIGQILTICS